MVQYDTPLGTVELTGGYFAALVGRAVSSSFGVVGMSAANPVDSVRLFIFPGEPDKGVSVTQRGGRLTVSLHIKVSYGVNIAATVENITEKVKYAVESETGLEVRRVDVYVDDIAG